ncbi:MAG: MoaE-MoaD fusion protein [Miltoncostaeaceae bacterium]|jgi:molybdopterin synthase catalytic subunit|nr:MoaE-MoaD fusion protein [Miltoncostaeaceae bacterium]
MVALSSIPLDLATLVQAATDPEHGGLVTFIGSTRRESDRRPVRTLVYEAYEELALRELQAIAEEAAARFGARLAVAHRTGRVPVGEPSVAVAASAPGRPEAFAACRYAIDELKARAPIWKQTEFADGQTTWLDGCQDREHGHWAEEGAPGEGQGPLPRASVRGGRPA